MPPKVSVITTTFKRPWGLLAAMRCVQAQTFKDLEYVVIGDHCPDAERVFDTECGPDQLLVNLAENANDLGVTPLNEGLRNVTGEWIAVLADDNLWTKDHIAGLVEAADNPDTPVFHMDENGSHERCDGPPDIVISACEVRHKAGKTRGYPCFRDETWPRWRGTDLGQCLYRRSLFETYGGWERQINGRDDYSFDWAKIEQFLVGGAKWARVPERYSFTFFVDE